MKNTLIYKLLFMVAILFIVSTSCKKDPIEPVVTPPNQNEEELITTMQLKFVDSAGLQANQTFQFRDTDGPGGAAPSQFDTIILQPNKTYFVSIELLNESASPVDTITAEILEEAMEHLFCFSPSIGGNLTVQRTDTDGTYELGLASKWTTNAVSTGTIEIKLKHQPGVKNGQCDPGDTDIELNFQVKIQ